MDVRTDRFFTGGFLSGKLRPDGRCQPNPEEKSESMPPEERTAILLVGHGSGLAEGQEAFETLAGMVRACGGYETVAIAYLARGEPDLAQAVEFCVAQGATRILLYPCFMFVGVHVRQDLPAQMAVAAARHPGLEWVLGEPLGAHPKLAEAVCARLDESLAKAGWQRS